MNGEIPKKDVLLVFINMSVGKTQNIVSPIQIMKGMFLISKELRIANFYEFVPFLYGPCSFEIYSDLKLLLENNLINSVISPFSWKYYKTTSMGSDMAKSISKALDKNLLREIIRIKKFVISKSFLELLSYIYEKYPEYAKNSIINIKVLEK